LHHPGIVAVADLLQDAHNYYLFMEFCPGGELFQYIVDRTKLRESEAKGLFVQVLTALSYVHSFHICHRDLKLENLLLDNTGRVKIGDFGLSRLSQDGLVRTPCGSPCYVAPECLANRPYDGRISDIWSCGVILYAMVTGQLPWTKRNQSDLFAQIKRGEYTIPEHVSPVCCDLIRRLVTVDIDARISLEEARNHPFFADAARLVEVSRPLPFLSLRQVDAVFRPDPWDDQFPNLKRPVSAPGIEFENCMQIVLMEAKFVERPGWMIQVEPRSKRQRALILSHLVAPKRLTADGSNLGPPIVPMVPKRLTADRRESQREVPARRLGGEAQGTAPKQARPLTRLSGDSREVRAPPSPSSLIAGRGRARLDARSSLPVARLKRSNV
jgi:serine/threonine protein kinase